VVSPNNTKYLAPTHFLVAAATHVLLKPVLDILARLLLYET
jgi:hypothetical protein